MTVVVAYQRVMVADGMAFVQGSRTFPTEPKIVRLHDGSLMGCSGTSSDCRAFTTWAVNGMHRIGQPSVQYGGFSALHLRRDGKIAVYDTPTNYSFQIEPVIIGDLVAQACVAGAIAAGADAEQAVLIALDRSASVGPPIQVERLDDAPQRSWWRRAFHR